MYIKIWRRGCIGIHAFDFTKLDLDASHRCNVQGRKMETTPLAMFGFYVERVKANLRIVMAMSPIGDSFRNRLRMFPSLINCCTIDWYAIAAR